MAITPGASPQPARISAAAGMWAAVAMLALGGCDKPQRPTPAGPGVTAAAAAKTVEVVPEGQKSFEDSLLTPEQQAIVVAEIGPRKLTLGQLEARLAREPSVVRAQHATIPKRKEYLANWVQLEVMADEAVRQGMDKDPAVVEAMRMQMVRRYLKEAVFDAVGPESVTDADVKAYYEANLHLYKKPVQVELRHILLPDKAAADKVLAELKAGSEGSAAKLNELWKDYVRRLTQDRTSIRQLGSLGLVSREPVPGLPEADQERLAALPKALIDAAMDLEPFQLGPVVKTDQGYHVVMITSRSPALDRSLEDVADGIRKRVLQRRRDVKRAELIAGLRQAAQVVIRDDAIRLLPPPGPRKKAAGKGNPAVGKAALGIEEPGDDDPHAGHGHGGHEAGSPLHADDQGGEGEGSN